MLKIEIDDLKMLGLKYVASAIPGKSLKRKPTVTEEELKSKQKYVENRKTRKFNEKWKQTYDWLMYDSDKNIMQCSVYLRGVTIHFFHKRYVSRYLICITIRIMIRFIGH